MATSQPARPARSPWITVAIVVLVILAACILIPICTIVLLALMGPAIGNVFSNIITSMTPVP